MRAKAFEVRELLQRIEGLRTGAGVSQALLSKHRGTLRFRSRTKSGTTGSTFQVFLPAPDTPSNSVTK